MNELLNILRIGNSRSADSGGTREVNASRLPPLEDSDPCRAFLADWAEFTGLVVSLYDSSGNLFYGPYFSSPLATIIAERIKLPSSQESYWERDLALEAAITTRPVSRKFESALDVVAQPVLVESRLIAVVSFGWSFAEFPDPNQCARLATAIEVPYARFWSAARSQTATPLSRLDLHRRMIASSLKGMLSEAVLRLKEVSITETFVALTKLLSEVNECISVATLVTTLARNIKSISGSEFVRVTVGRDANTVSASEGEFNVDNMVNRVLEPLSDLHGQKFGEIEFVLRGDNQAAQMLRKVIAAQVAVSVERLESIRELRDERRELAETASKLQLLNSRLEQFTGVAAHDLQAPLRNMRMFSQLLERELGNHQSERVREYVGTIEAGAQRLSMLVGELLSLSSSGRPGNLENFRLDEAVKIAMSDLDGLLPLQSLSVGTLPVVRGNKVLVTQVLRNLIGNAIKYASRKDVRVSIDCAQDGQFHRVCVSDNGPGISGEYLDRIFEPFFRLSPNDEIQGFGLGLPLCRQIIKGHGGEIWVESLLNSGSQFCFTLPLAKSTERHDA